ncbi:MAG: ATP-dependent DNA helicase [Thermoplasmatota archaeon]
MELFPYKLRKNQKTIMQNISKNLALRNHLIFESGTGSGKTICTLAATLQYALENNKKILYATRTNAQQRQVIVELRSIKQKNSDSRIFGVGMQGRSNMCLLARQDPDIASGNSEELSKFCSYQKKLAATDNNKGCLFYKNYIGDKKTIDHIVNWTKKKLPTTEEFIEYCEHKNICPYEVNKQLIKEAIVVVVPYVYVFDKSIRIMLFDWLSISEQDIILIVDEAHNLPNYIRDLLSAQLSMWMLNGCVNEAKKFGDPTISGRKIKVSTFCNTLIEIINGLRDTYVYGILEDGIRTKAYVKNDAFIPSHELEYEIMSRLKITSKALQDIITDLVAYGEKIKEYQQKDGKLPRSYLYKLGVFLEFWMHVEMNQYVKLIVDSSDGKNPRVEAYCLDPSIGTEIINQFHCSIHMSGTLEPLEEYRDSLGFTTETELVFYPSFFSKQNRLILYVSDVSTRYEDLTRDKRNIPTMWKYITSICNSFPKNVMVCFPSFNTLSLFQNQGDFDEINSGLYVEERSMSQYDLMNLVKQFKSCPSEHGDGAALFSVMGGRISEGMDFPAEQLEIAIIVGIPYPKPTARQRGLQKYYEYKFGKGWEYTVKAPAARKLLQSIGRLIRHENDRGVAIILDRRASQFKNYIPDMVQSKNPLDDVNRFLKQ